LAAAFSTYMAELLPMHIKLTQKAQKITTARDNLRL